jgi:hypothetical protein
MPADIRFRPVAFPSGRVVPALDAEGKGASDMAGFNHGSTRMDTDFVGVAEMSSTSFHVSHLLIWSPLAVEFLRCDDNVAQSLHGQ